MVNFFQKLASASQRNHSLLCVGLDPDPALMPVTDIASFNRAIIDATCDLVCAYKPNLAFYEAQGMPGLKALEETLKAIPANIPVIADAKRGDIGNTARFYARALFDSWGFDAATVNPYLGKDSLEPFLEYGDRGVFVLCHTSNPGAADFQAMYGEGRPLYQWVALKAREWNGRGNVGLVVGAPFPEALRELRQLCPELPFLIPGIGAQQGELTAAVRYGSSSGGLGPIINASRQVIYASRSGDFAQGARRAAIQLRDAIRGHLEEYLRQAHEGR